MKILHKLISMIFLTGLIIFAQDRPADENKADEIKELIQKLSDDELEIRNDATQRLIEIGKDALPELKKAIEHEDPEVSQRAKNIIEEIRKSFLKIIISAEDEKCKMEQKIKMKIEFKNEGDEDIIVLAPHDASYRHARGQPFITWKVIDSKGEEYRTKRFFSCPEEIDLRNRPSEENFLIVKKGETLDVTTKGFWYTPKACYNSAHRVSKPGRYKMALNYSFKREFSADYPEVIKNLIQKALEVDIRSNEIEIEVTE